MSYSFLVRDVRAQFGFSQQELAAWLGVSRALLASVETGREQLPRHARPWLFPWLTALGQLPEPAPAPASPPLLGELAGPDAVVARLRECDYQARRLHLEHTALVAKHQRAARSLAAGPVLLAALPPLPAATAPAEPVALALRRRWLGRLLEAATDALLPEAPAGPSAAVLLAARRQAYLHEAALLQDYLAVARTL